MRTLREVLADSARSKEERLALAQLSHRLDKLATGLFGIANLIHTPVTFTKQEALTILAPGHYLVLSSDVHGEYEKGRRPRLMKTMDGRIYVEQDGKCTQEWEKNAQHVFISPPIFMALKITVVFAV